ncbi:SDR family oxidoreductase [Streptomyces subrutilus]|uniref:NmrA family transcriptional regulator n=1 Tax=Streptomyces subrutilus TaxID=36818 RepID=A0A1E5Q0Q9_9ACTN|nr:NAD(P)H-binding protein [Streptomyces subrutilus]OEJ35387.1 NmrA family transcriptional regulator [Streptomyces subrutilus]
MDWFEQLEETPATEGLCLLTVVSPRKREGSSPTGIIGRHVARQLLEAGRQVRVLAEPSQCDGWPESVEVVEGSITQPLECAQAFDDVGAVFLAGAHPSTVQEALSLARNAGAGRVVVLSSHGPEYEEAYPPETWFWLAIEKAAERSGLVWTHLRPSAVMGALIEGTYPATGADWPDTIRATAVVREAFLEQGRYPFIHEEDLAAVAVAALLSHEHAGTIIEGVGLPLSTRSRIESIAAALGHDIDTVDLRPDESRAVWQRLGWPDSAIDVTLYALKEYGTRYAELVQWTLDQRPTVKSIIGRPLRSYAEWVSENIDVFR